MMNREDMESRFAALRESLAAELSRADAPHSWTLAPPHPGAMPGDDMRWFRVLPAGDGLALSVVLDTYKGRVAAHPNAPMDCRGDTLWWQDIMPRADFDSPRPTAPEIGASIEKSPAQIARDIARRLLPAVREAWPVFAKRLKEAEDMRDARAATLAWCAERGGVWYPVPDYRKHESVTVRFPAIAGSAPGVNLDGRDVYAEVSPYGSVEFRARSFKPGAGLDSILAVLRSTAEA